MKRYEQIKKKKKNQNRLNPQLIIYLMQANAKQLMSKTAKIIDD